MSAGAYGVGPEALIERGQALLEEAGVTSPIDPEADLADLSEEVEKLSDRAEHAELFAAILDEELSSLRAAFEGHMEGLAVVLSEVMATIRDIDPLLRDELKARITARLAPESATAGDSSA